MKKLILIALAIFTAGITYAQLIPGFTIGPKVGASFSKFSTDIDDLEAEMKNTLHFGVFARIGKKVYFQPELLVNTRKGEMRNSNLDLKAGTVKVGSLDVPLLVGYRLIDAKVFNIRAMAGPSVNKVINKTIELDEGWDDDINLTEDNLRDLNWGFQFGAGVDVLMFAVDLRYEIGLNDFSKLDNFDLKNNTFTLSVGWKIL
jgi:hypothetical protein